ELASNCFSHNSAILVLPSLASFVKISKLSDAADASCNAASEFYKVLLENDEVVGFLKEVDISSLDASYLNSEDIDLVNAYLAQIGCSTKVKISGLDPVQRGQQSAAEVTVSQSQKSDSFEGKDIKAAYEYLATLDSSHNVQDSFQVLANEFVTNYYKDKVDKDQLGSYIFTLYEINEEFSESLSQMIFSNPDLKQFVSDNSVFLKQAVSNFSGLMGLLQKIDSDFEVNDQVASREL
ncbi:hypothetical protein OAP83_03225, partial [Rickettsiales bacterium]|nr:hypothetical protein [Rickettsiales bacterium]